MFYIGIVYSVGDLELEGINNRFNGLENFRSVRTAERNENKNESKKVKIAKDDPYMKWPLRGMAYTNELGEIIRPMNGLMANLLWVPAIGYIAADVADKYKNNPEGEKEPSKRRAAKQLSFQMLASVILPTVAVKAGQKLTNVISSKGSKPSINDRQTITNSIIDSMDKGSHEKFVDAATGLVDREKYSKHIISNFASKEQHAKSGGKMFGFLKPVYELIKKPFNSSSNSDSIGNYVRETVDNVMDMRESLLEGEKPAKVSEKLFNTFVKDLKGADVVKKESAAFNIIKKAQDKKLFKNNALKSLGGLIALSIMMKPIDHFVEHVLIERCISPAIDYIGKKPWKSLPETAQQDDKKLAA